MVIFNSYVELPEGISWETSAQCQRCEIIGFHVKELALSIEEIAHEFGDPPQIRVDISRVDVVSRFLKQDLQKRTMI